LIDAHRKCATWFAEDPAYSCSADCPGRPSYRGGLPPNPRHIERHVVARVRQRARDETYGGSAVRRRAARLAVLAERDALDAYLDAKGRTAVGWL
jgi:hypothetical protein